MPRFQRDHYAKNHLLAESLKAFAGARGASSSQVALAWLQSKNVTALFGTSKRKHLEDDVLGFTLSSSCRMPNSRVDSLQ